MEDFLGHYVGNETVAHTMQHLSSVPLNTDDRTVIEFAFARMVGVSGGFQLVNLRASSHAAMADRPQLIEGEVNWSRVNEARLSMFESLSRAEERDDNFTAGEKHRAGAFADYMTGDLPGALREWQAQTDQPATLSQLAMVAECLASEGDSAASAYIDKLAEIFPWEADAIRAELFWTQRRPDQAADLFEKCLRGLNDLPLANRDLIKRTLNRVEIVAKSDRSKIASNFLFDALRKPFCVYTDEAERLGTQLALAIYLEGTFPGEKLRATVESFEPHVLWRKEFLQVRKDCYTALHDPRAKQAERDLEEFRKYEPATADVSAMTRSILDQKANPGSP